MSNPHNANYSKQINGYRVRVMCPECNAGGAQYVNSIQPKCHMCDDAVYMQPANNTEIVCTWGEFIKFMKDKHGNK